MPQARGDREPAGQPRGLVGVGVGPGDPELVTLQAIRVLSTVDRVVAPTVSGAEEGRAESVVKGALPGLAIRRLVFSMTPDSEPGGAQARADSHRAAAEAIVEMLDAGESVAFVTIGDPNVYSTFPSVAEAVTGIRPATEVTTVPGICAFQALAARSGTVLLDGTESLALVTALDGPEHVREALENPSRAIVVYKGGRHLPSIARLLEEADRMDGAVIGERLGLEGERVATVKQVAGEELSYLATVIVPPAS
jgi:precorrin-2/cobalt-factor-2 C20-methyltransferase